MTRTLVAWVRVAVSPSSNSTVAPAASVRRPSRATSASLSRGRNGGDGIGAVGIAAHPLSGRGEVPSIDPQSAALSTASDRPPGASRELISSVKTVMRGMLLAPASVMLRRAYARPAQRLARRDGGGC